MKIKKFKEELRKAQKRCIKKMVFTMFRIIRGKSGGIK